MKKSFFSLIGILVLASMLLSSCSLPGIPAQNGNQAGETTAAEPAGECAAAPEAGACAANGPTYLHGTMAFSNDIILKYYVEHAVALVDMHAFVVRDEEWEIPLKSQTLGYIKIDEDAMTGEYELQLPALPAALQNDVDNDSQTEPGVQTFAVSYWPNLYGDPYSVGDDHSEGWPSYLASVKTDPENKDEVIGGKLVVWAPDGQQSFPSGFGADGLLFTADDPQANLPAGYSIVDLDQSPFAFSREQDARLDLYEPSDAAVKDYSDLSYSEAFKNMFDFLKREYAFNDIPDKAPDWDKTWSEIQPKVAAAEADADPLAYYVALQEFTMAFKDGHVGLDGGDLGRLHFSQKAGGGLGLAVRELDDGQVVVTYVDAAGPAGAAGMQVGALLTKWNNLPIAEAIDAVQTLSGPSSTERDRRFQKTLFLTRSPLGTSVKVTFENPGGRSQTAVLTSVDEINSLYATDAMRNYDPYALPVEYFVPDQRIGYIRVNSNYDDLNLILRLFERGLKTFEEAGVQGVIIDLRNNAGGASLGFAAFLTEEEIPMSQLEYYSDKTGKFEPEGEPGKLTPNETVYLFDRVVTLVDSGCASACEIEAYSLSQVEGMMVVGMNPTAGVEAEVARGKFELPEGMSLQAPTGRFVMPDGSLFLEGVGVQPDVRVSIDYENVMNNLQNDVVLLAAVEEILKP